RIDRPAFGVASRLDAPERILQIDARTNVIRDHGDRVNVEAHGLGSRVRSSSCNLPRNSVTRATMTIPVNRGLKKSIASPPFARSQGVPDSLSGQSRATRLGSALQFRTFVTPVHEDLFVIPCVDPQRRSRLSNEMANSDSCRFEKVVPGTRTTMIRT